MFISKHSSPRLLRAPPQKTARKTAAQKKHGEVFSSHLTLRVKPPFFWWAKRWRTAVQEYESERGFCGERTGVSNLLPPALEQASFLAKALSVQKIITFAQPFSPLGEAYPGISYLGLGTLTNPLQRGSLAFITSLKIVNQNKILGRPRTLSPGVLGVD